MNLVLNYKTSWAVADDNEKQKIPKYINLPQSLFLRMLNLGHEPNASSSIILFFKIDF